MPMPRAATSNRAASATLRLSLHTPIGAAYGSYVRKNLRAAHKILQPALRELSLALVNDKRMSELHQRFMNIPGPTDVLTFPLEVDSQKQVISGEVVVCGPEARRRAAEQGHSIQQELLLYALHGMLHLCGYDDRTDRQYRQMHRTEDAILTKLGIGPTFSPSRAATPPRPSRKRRRP